MSIPYGKNIIDLVDTGIVSKTTALVIMENLSGKEQEERLKRLNSHL